MDNVEKTKRYFDRNVERLGRMKETQQSGIAKAAALSLEGKLKGEILDIGSGEHIDYSLESIDRLVCLDISSGSLERAEKNNKIEFIPGDARNLNMKDNLFDCVVILHTLHHLAGNSLTATHKNIEACFNESHRVLKKTGKILIIDAVCPRIVQGIENLLFKLSFLVLGLCDKPMVYYFSLSDLMNILSKVGFKKMTFSYLNTGNAKHCPFTSSIGIPFKYTPLSHFLIEGVK
ncbi:MAG: class I SAM-dependent methyltransferase [Candidatus Omnitrophica bacterium]|nr:class I SAM-dependent methyltransferase [Candidatus Omnitrophota bacterium]